MIEKRGLPIPAASRQKTPFGDFLLQRCFAVSFPTAVLLDKAVLKIDEGDEGEEGLKMKSRFWVSMGRGF